MERRNFSHPNLIFHSTTSFLFVLELQVGNHVAFIFLPLPPPHLRSHICTYMWKCEASEICLQIFLISLTAISVGREGGTRNLHILRFSLNSFWLKRERKYVTNVAFIVCVCVCLTAKISPHRISSLWELPLNHCWKLFSFCGWNRRKMR